MLGKERQPLLHSPPLSCPSCPQPSHVKAIPNGLNREVFVSAIFRRWEKTERKGGQPVYSVTRIVSQTKTFDAHQRLKGSFQMQDFPASLRIRNASGTYCEFHNGHNLGEKGPATR